MRGFQENFNIITEDERNEPKISMFSILGSRKFVYFGWYIINICWYKGTESNKREKIRKPIALNASNSMFCRQVGCSNTHIPFFSKRGV